MNAPQINPPPPVDNPAKSKPWFVADVFGNAHAALYQDRIRVLMQKTAAAEKARRTGQAPRQDGVSEEGRERIREARRRACMHKRMDTDARALEALRSPMTVDDLARAIGFSRNGTFDVLYRLRDEGKVAKAMVKNVSVWSAVQ